MPKASSTLNAIVSPRSGKPGIEGKRFSHAGVNDSHASMEKTQEKAAADQKSPSQNKITVIAAASPRRDNMHTRCPTQDLILPPGMEALSRDFNMQLKAIQTALRESLT